MSPPFFTANIISLLVAAMFALTSQAAVIKPFTSDGCSVFPEGTDSQKELWLQCCREHDFAYWRGGTRRQRIEADRQLRRCVARVGEPEIAALMFAGVRVGGSPFLPTSFRWGYGWPFPRFYGELSAEELQQIEDILRPTDPR
jgi:hypothetical protein